MNTKIDKLITNKWIECSEDNCWVDDDSELKDTYFTVVCMPLESYDDKNDTTLNEQFIYVHDNCPCGWGTLTKAGAKFMVIEKP